MVFEENIKVADEVMGVCELFGFEPYELANEGTFVMAVDEKQAEDALKILREFDKNAMIMRRSNGGKKRACHHRKRLQIKKISRAAKGRATAKDLLMHELSIVQNLVSLCEKNAAKENAKEISKNRE